MSVYFSHFFLTLIKKLKLLISILSIFCFIDLYSQLIPIKLVEEKNQKVYIYYDLILEDTIDNNYTVNVYKYNRSSNWSDSDYKKLTNVSGDVGSNQTTGYNKTIIWNPKIGRKNTIGDLEFRIEVGNNIKSGENDKKEINFMPIFEAVGATIATAIYLFTYLL